MNNLERQRLARLVEKLEAIRDEIEEMFAAEADKFDYMPEGLQCSECGEAIKEARDALQEAYDNLDSVVDDLYDLI